MLKVLVMKNFLVKKPSYLENYQLTSMRNLKNFDNYPLFNVLNDKS